MKTKFFALLATLLLVSFGAQAAVIPATGHYAATKSMGGEPIGTVDLQSLPLSSPNYLYHHYTGTPAEGVSTLDVWKGGIVQGNSAWNSLVDYSKPSSLSSHEKYLAIFSGGKAVFSLGDDVTKFSFLWGSIDTDNKVTVTNFDNNTYSFTGQDLLLSLGYKKKQLDNVTGTIDAYVTITDYAGIKSIVMEAVCKTFEVARITAVPLPGGLVLFGSGLIGLVLRRKGVLSGV